MENLFLPIMLVGMVMLMVFMSRKARKQQQAQMEFRSQLAVGQEIMTASGLFGTIVDIDVTTDRVTIESAGSRTIWLRAAISKRVDGAAMAAPAAEVTTAAESTSAIDDGLSGLDSAQAEYLKSLEAGK